MGYGFIVPFEDDSPLLRAGTMGSRLESGSGATRKRIENRESALRC